MKKICARCKQVEIEALGNRKYCKPCAEIQSRENARKASKKARERNPKRAREIKARYRERNREKLRASARRYNNSRSRKRRKREWDSKTRFDGLKEAVLERDNYQCVKCGATEDDGWRNIIIHHIDGDKENNTLDNLETLCRSCHAKAHGDWSEKRRSKHSRAMKRAARTEAERRRRSRAKRQWWAELSDKDREELSVKLSKAARNKSEEVRRNHSEYKRQWWANLSEERYQEVCDNISEGRKK